MDDRAICLPWDKNFVLTPLGQTVVYTENCGKFAKIYKGIRKCPSVSIPSGTDTEKSSKGEGGCLLNGIAHRQLANLPSNAIKLP